MNKRMSDEEWQQYMNIAAAALGKCAANDPWFPKPSVATVQAWAEAIADYKLGPDDVLTGVKNAYRDNGSGFKPLPHDIVQAARAVRRDRADREDETQRREREALIDAKVEGRLKAIVGTFGNLPDA